MHYRFWGLLDSCLAAFELRLYRDSDLEAEAIYFMYQRKRGPTNQHFSFEQGEMEWMKAHNGEGDVLTQRVLTETDGASCHFLDLVIIPVDCSVGFHHHNTNEEYYVILSGNGEMQLDEARFPVSTGHVIVNRPGGAHGLVNVGNEPIKLVVIEIPAKCP